MLALHVHSSRPSSGSSSRSTQRPTSAQASKLCAVIFQMILHATADTAQARNSMTLDLNSHDTKRSRSAISPCLYAWLTLEAEL